MCIRTVIVVLSAIVHGEMYFKDTETCMLDIKKNDMHRIKVSHFCESTMSIHMCKSMYLSLKLLLFQPRMERCSHCFILYTSKQLYLFVSE